MTRPHRVLVWGKPVEVEVYQRSKSVWIATGSYMGEHLETKSQSPGSALRLWKDAATYRGNG
jgi:hypothetical protein